MREGHDPQEVNRVTIDREFLWECAVLIDDRRHWQHAIEDFAPPERLRRIAVGNGVTVTNPGLVVVRKMSEPAEGLDIFLTRLIAIENEFDAA